MAINMIGTTEHLRMAKSVLSDLRNRGFMEHASIIFAGDEEKVGCLDNIISETSGQNEANKPYDAGVVEMPPLGLVASIGPAYGVLADIAESPDGALDDACRDMGIQGKGQKLIEQWLDQGKYVLLINGTSDEHADFFTKQLGELQGIDDLTIC